MRSKAARGILAALCLAVVACAGVETPLTRPGEPSQADYMALADRAPPPAPAVPAAEPPIPDLQPILVAPPPAAADSRLVSLSVTEDVPLRDVMIELAREADVNLEMDPGIEGSIVFIARDRPLLEVLERISAMAGLRYRFQDNFLRVERDLPYVENYPLDWLAMERIGTSSVETSSNILAAVEGGAAVGGNGSEANIASQTASNLWETVRANLAEILANTALPGAAADAAAALSVNPQAGVIAVYGTSRQQRAVAAYLDRTRRAVASQVLIEARIVEVSLNDRFRAGIDWATIFDRGLDVGFNAVPGATIPTAATATEGFTAVLQTGDFTALVDLLRDFGTTRTLSSPRITVINNQMSVLKVAENEVYFTFDVVPAVIDPETGVVLSRSTIQSTPRSVPIGLVMTVQPAVDAAAGEVMLNLRPTITRVARRVEDPGVSIAAAQADAPQIRSEIPVVEVREMDSVVRMRSGETVVMGGLLQERVTGDTSGIPGAMDVPLAGNLFKRQDARTSVVELVIFLRATIVDGARTVAPADLDLYRNFTNDPRPLTF